MSIQEWLNRRAEMRQKKKTAKRMREIADLFNKAHVFGGHHEWMCPDCNKVHPSCGFNVFTGLEYPKCCSTGYIWRDYILDSSLPRLPMRRGV